MPTRQRFFDSRQVDPAPNRPVTTPAQQILRPILAALAIDLVDLATFGPVGLYTGLILGAAAGYWLAPILGFPLHRRWLSALATGVYCTLPMTGLIPLATLVSVIARSLMLGNLRVDTSRETDPAGAIDVEYEIVADDPKSHRSESHGNDRKSNNSKSNDSRSNDRSLNR